MRSLHLFAFLLLTAMSSLAQDSLHITKIGQLAFPGHLADVQAYLAPNGAEYAIVTYSLGVSIVSLANPSQPFILHDIPGGSAINREAETFGQYAFVTSEANEGLRIIDLSGLPGSIAYKDTILDTITRSHTLYISDSVLYLFFSSTNPGACLYSLADPWRPARIGTYTAGSNLHDGYVRDHIGYLCDFGAGTLKVVDFHDPSQPQDLGAVPTPMGVTHNAWLSDNGTICYVAEESAGAWVVAYDVSDPANITETDRIRPSYAAPDALPHNVKVKQDWLVTAHYTEGLHIVDAARPHNLVEVAYYDHSTMAPGNFAGSWGADPYLPSGLVLSSDMENGLIVLQPTYLRACYLEGRVTDAQTGLPILGATITVQASPWNTRSDPAGNYALGTVTPGSYQAHYAKPGYRDSLLTVQLSNGVLSQIDVPLQPLAPVHVDVQVLESGSNLPLPGAALTFVRLADTLSSDFNTDAAGQLSTSQLTQGAYMAYTGHWGHATVALGPFTLYHDTALTVQLGIGYHDPFAVGLGWTASGTASSGAWVRARPQPTYALNNGLCNPAADLVGDPGDLCFVTGNSGGWPQDDDVDQGTVVLESPAMDLSHYDQPWLHISTWFCSRTYNGNLGGDSLWLELDNGNTTHVLRLRTNHLAAWVADSFPLAGLLPMTQNMRLRVRVKEKQFDRIVEAGIDGFRISGTVLAARPEPSDRHPGAALSISPNPAVGASTVVYALGVSGRHKEARFEVTDLTGRIVYAQPLSAASGSFPLGLDLPAGVYLATLRVGGEPVRHVRLLR